MPPMPRPAATVPTLGAPQGQAPQSSASISTRVRSLNRRQPLDHGVPKATVHVEDELLLAQPQHADQRVEMAIGREQQGLGGLPVPQAQDVLAALPLQVGGGLRTADPYEVPRPIVCRRPVEQRPVVLEVVLAPPGPASRFAAARSPPAASRAAVSWRAAATAARSAAALCAHSASSLAGSLSATIPAPACTDARPSGVVTSVRMAIAVSRLPEKSR